MKAATLCQLLGTSAEPTSTTFGEIVDAAQLNLPLLDAAESDEWIYAEIQLQALTVLVRGGAYTVAEPFLVAARPWLRERGHLGQWKAYSILLSQSFAAQGRLVPAEELLGEAMLVETDHEFGRHQLLVLVTSEQGVLQGGIADAGTELVELRRADPRLVQLDGGVGDSWAPASSHPRLGTRSGAVRDSSRARRRSWRRQLHGRDVAGRSVRGAPRARETDRGRRPGGREPPSGTTVRCSCADCRCPEDGRDDGDRRCQPGAARRRPRRALDHHCRGVALPGAHRPRCCTSAIGRRREVS